ncbi:MAG: ankyrin repeat domain-containing protein [Candidatus Buchananbacteria bacterium]
MKAKESLLDLLGPPIIGLIIGLTAVMIYFSTASWAAGDLKLENWFTIFFAFHAFVTIVYICANVLFIASDDESEIGATLSGMIGILVAPLASAVMCGLPVMIFDAISYKNFVDQLGMYDLKSAISVSVINVGFYFAIGLVWSVIMLPFKFYDHRVKILKAAWMLLKMSLKSQRAKLRVMYKVHEVAITGNWQGLEDLRAKFADINALDGRGRTPLHLAILNNQLRIVRMLVMYGARTDIASQIGGLFGEELTAPELARHELARMVNKLTNSENEDVCLSDIAAAFKVLKDQEEEIAALKNKLIEAHDIDRYLQSQETTTQKGKNKDAGN